MKKLTLNELIKRLQKYSKKHGKHEVYFVDHYDHCTGIECVAISRPDAWDGSPVDRSFLYLC